MVEEHPEETKRIESEYHETTATYFGRSGTNDYSKDVTEVEKIVDSAGTTRRGVWNEEFTDVFPGVQTKKEGSTSTVRISKSACPVRILFHHWSEYGSWDGSGPSGQTSKRYWVRYVCLPALAGPMHRNPCSE